MQTLHTSLLTNEELTTASARLLPLCTPLFTGQALLIAIAAAAEKDSAAMIQAASRQTASGFTDALKEGDSVRDTAFVTLRDLCGTAVKNPVGTPEQRAAGARLVEIIARHGNSIHSLGYTQESGKVKALLAELRGTTPTADLTLLGLLPLFNQLASAQTAFEEIMADKAAAEGGQALPTVAEHRPKLMRRLNLLLANLEEWQDLAPTSALTAAIGQIDEVILLIATPALARRTRNQPETPPEPAP